MSETDVPAFRNDGGDVLTLGDLGQSVGPYERFEWPGYDPAVHGPVSGCTWLNPPADDPPKDPPPPDSSSGTAKADGPKRTAKAAADGADKTEVAL